MKEVCGLLEEKLLVPKVLLIENRVCSDNSRRIDSPRYVHRASRHRRRVPSVYHFLHLNRAWGWAGKPSNHRQTPFPTCLQSVTAEDVDNRCFIDTCLCLVPPVCSGPCSQYSPLKSSIIAYHRCRRQCHRHCLGLEWLAPVVVSGNYNY